MNEHETAESCVLYLTVQTRIDKAIEAFQTDMAWIEPCFDELFSNHALTNRQRNYLDGYLVGRIAAVRGRFDPGLTAADFENHFDVADLLRELWIKGLPSDGGPPVINGIISRIKEKEHLRISEKAFLEGFGNAMAMSRTESEATLRTT